MRRAASRRRRTLARPAESTLGDLVDHVLNKGVVLSGEVVLGLAGVDLVYLRLQAILAAADRVQGAARRR
ncbi:MAG TPA: gas vesicle protein [Vicinamibacteria bacterium]|nr:gas vesicle protein [Vicinamibacteria bacterium]